jgi:hypothetical protein
MKGNAYIPFMRSRGDGSTLNLDFTKMGALDSRFTFTRSTTATYIDSSGYVASAAINEARFEYDATTLAASGLLIESAATNLLNFSETFATTGGTNNNWADTNLTRTSTNNTSPRNDATALQLTASAANGTIISSAAIGTSAARTLSVWLRRVTGTGNIQYTLDNGSTYTTQAITAVWVRYTFATTTAAQRVGFRIVTSADAIEIWGAQLETGTGASSYIPTTTAQVTRAKDVCTMSGTNFTSWFNNTEGTVLFIGNNTIVPAASGFPANWALINAANSSRITQYTRHTTGRIGASCRDSGGGALTFDSPAATTAILTTAEYKTAFALKSSDFAYSVNGAAVGLGDGVGVFETVVSLDFARDGIRNGHIKCFKFWPTRLTNAQLIAIST